MQTIHIIRKSFDPLAEEAVCFEAAREPLAVLLIQDGVLNTTSFPGKVFVNREDLEARVRESPYQKVDYADIVRLILEYDRTIVW